MSVLTSYCHKDSKDLEKSIRVGVVGLPNVGRKSLINTLKKSRGIETTGKAQVHISCVPHLTTIWILTS
jgi:ribosome biogenesis GTPase A